MKNFSGRPTFFGVIAAILGVLSLSIAAFWKNAIVNHEATTDGYSAAVGVDALIIGAFVILGGLLLIGAIVLIVIGWFVGQQQGSDNYMPDPLQPGGANPPEDHSVLPPVQPNTVPEPTETGYNPSQPPSQRF